MEKDMLLEIARCYASMDYGIGKYLKSYNHVTGTREYLTLYPKFIEVINAHQTNRFNIIKKSRQIGGSTMFASMAAMTMVTASPYERETIVTMHNKRDMGMEFLNKVRDFLKQLPRELWGKDFIGSEDNLKRELFTTNTKTEIRLPNGSRIKCVTTSDELCGISPTWLIMDEAAFLDKGEEMFGMGMRSLASGGRVTLLSTPNGYDPLFYNMYFDAIDGNNDFNVINIMWYDDPRFNWDLTWIKNGEIVKEKEFTPESFSKMEQQGYRPTSSWYRDMCRVMFKPHFIIQELDARFIKK